MKDTISMIMLHTHGRVKEPVSTTITFDNKELTIVGKADVVISMKTWLLAAWKKEDHEDLMKHFFIPTKPTKPIYFPLIAEERWTSQFQFLNSAKGNHV